MKSPRRSADYAAEIPDVSSALDVRRFNTLLWLVFAGGIVPNLLTYLGQPHRSLNAHEHVVRPGYAVGAAQIIAMLTMIYSAHVIASVVRSGRTARFGSGLAIAMIPVIGSLADTENDGVTRLASAVPTALTVLAVSMLPTRLSQLRTVLTLGALASVLAILMAVTMPENAYFGNYAGQIGGSVKALIGNDQLAGPFGHSNGLGVCMALVLPYALTIPRARYRRLLSALILFTLAWSASRSAILAAACVLVMWTCLRRCRSSVRAIVVTVALLAIATAIILLPMLTRDPRAFTSRGAIWNGSFDEWAASPVIGLGNGWYSRVAQYRNDLGVQATSGHNLFVDSLTTGGIIGLVLVGVALVGAISRLSGRLGDDDGLAAALFLCGFGVLSIAEAVLVISLGSEMFWITGFAIATIATSTETTGAAQRRGSAGVYGDPRERAHVRH